jgi:hypothetical protein
VNEWHVPAALCPQERSKCERPNKRHDRGQKPASSPCRAVRLEYGAKSMTDENVTSDDVPPDWEVVARLFRAGGDAVYPGVVIVMRSDSFHFHPVADHAVDVRAERIMGIATWGAQPEFEIGCVAVPDGPELRYAPVIAGDVKRPTTKIGRIDAWIARADALRCLRRGRVNVFGRVPTPEPQLGAAVLEIERIVRESAMALLLDAPPGSQRSADALAVVADSTILDDVVLTSAILTLLADSTAWAGLKLSFLKPSVDGPTQTELIRATEDKAARIPGIGATLFQELIRQSGIRPTQRGEKGRRFTPDEVRKLIETARRTNKQARARIAVGWAPWATR